MPILTEKQIQYGFDYFHRDEESPRSVVEVSEYNGETALTINCTQLGDMFTPQFDTAKKKKRVLSEWIDFLSENTTAFTELNFGTNLPQELFDAICRQENLRKLNLNGADIRTLAISAIWNSLLSYILAEEQVCKALNR